jgi:tripartite-type tricarboxylate transporter receptor subunit TctC
MSMPEVKERLAEQATVVTLSTPEDLGRFLAEENAKYRALVKSANIKLE